MIDAISQFKDAMRATGLEPPEVVEAGKFHRFPGIGKRNGNTSGWCKLFSGGLGGSFGDWSLGLSENWQAERDRPFTAAERTEYKRHEAEAKAQADAERKIRQAEAATKATTLWKAATPANTDHPYLVRKHVSPVATLREIEASAAAVILGYAPKSSAEALSGRLLVAPVKVGDLFSTCELIDESGRKSAVYGGVKAGGYWAAQHLPKGTGDGQTLLIGEGVATMVSAKEASGHMSIAALSAGNLPVVAKIMRERYPAAVLVILADLVKTTGEVDPHAGEAVRAVDGLLAIPDFGTDRPAGATDFNDMAVQCGVEAVRRCLQSATPVAKVATVAVANGKGSEPRPLNVREWPKPLAGPAFHGLAGEIVHAIENDTEADPAALLLQVLAAFGSMVGRGPHWRVEGVEHHGNLFVLLVGDTSKGRKGTSWGRVANVFNHIDDKAREVSGLSSGEGLKWAVRDEITSTRYNKEKETTEEVIEDPGVSDKRLLVQEGEFAQVLRACVRNGNTLSATIRSTWDSGNLSTLTKNDTVTATGAHIAIIGHITADELRAELTATDSANGFANRFLFVCVRRSRVLPFGGAEADAARMGGFAHHLERAAAQARDQGAVPMTASARAIWEHVYESLSDGRPGLLGAVTGRAEAQCVRLALLYALLDESNEIDEPHLLAALAVWDYCFASARFIFGDALGDRVADDILRAVRGAGEDGMSRTDIRNLFQKHQSAERIGAALELLASRGLVWRESVNTGGRPAELWRSS